MDDWQASKCGPGIYASVCQVFIECIISFMHVWEINGVEMKINDNDRVKSVHDYVMRFVNDYSRNVG